MNDETRNLLKGLRAMAALEVAQIEEAGAQFGHASLPLVAQVPPRADAAVMQALDTVVVTDDDLTPEALPVTWARLWRCAVAVAGDAAADLGAELQVRADTSVSAEIARLYAFAVTCDTLLGYARTTLLRSDAAPLGDNAGSLADRLHARPSAATVDAPTGVLCAGDLTALFRALGTRGANVRPAAPSVQVATPDDLRRICLAAVQEAIADGALAESAERLALSAITDGFRALARELEAFLDSQWQRFDNLPAAAFQSPLAPAAPDVYEIRGTSPLPPAPVSAATCAQCGAPLKPNHRFCQVCGTAAAIVLPAPVACPGCGASLKPGAKFCGACGTTLASSAYVQSDALPGVQCSACGGGIKPGERFCGACGAPVQPSTLAPTGAPHAIKPLEATVETTATCYRCGATLKTGEKFCGACGAPALRNAG
jgi:predicted amidophosphoribosyltransferase